MDEILLKELRQIINRCWERGIRLFVIGAYSLKAYGCLLRHSFDLDLAVEERFLPELVDVLQELGFVVSPKDVWVTATKDVAGEKVALHIAVDKVVDLTSARSYPLSVEDEVRLQPADLDFELPVFSIEGVLITKLLALRATDVIDIVSLLVRQANVISPGRLFMRALEANIEQTIAEKLTELESMIESGEVDAIWFAELGSLWPAVDRAKALEQVVNIRRYFEMEG